MAATVSTPQFLLNSSPVGPIIRAASAVLTPDTSYPTGGYAVTAATFGLTSISDVIANIVGGSSNNGAVSASYNAATGKVQLWVTAGTSPVTLAEAANAANLSGVTVKLYAFGY